MEDAGVPLLRRRRASFNFPAIVATFVFTSPNIVRQVFRDGFNQEILNPFCYCVDDKIIGRYPYINRADQTAGEPPSGPAE